LDISHAIQRTSGKDRTEGDNVRRPSFLDHLKRLKPDIDERIMFHIASGGAGDTFDKRLEAPLRHGKRMRGGLLMLIYESFGGPGPGRDMALDLAAAVEIAHAASLIVDDMLDEDDTRHGMEAVHVTTGQKGAILGTVALLSYPYQIVSGYGQQYVVGMARTHRAMVRAATRETMGVPSFGVGQAYDGIIENKTGALFGLAARFGGCAAGCPDHIVELLAEYGLLTGKAMQVADDIADLGQLLNGRSPGIAGSEAILLRCCLDQTQDGEAPAKGPSIPTGPIGSARRRDIEGIAGRYLQARIEEAEGAARRLDPIGGSGRHDLPDLRTVPEEIASMILREG
jgi:geranylgeranyl diphosphate synthase, type II